MGQVPEEIHNPRTGQRMRFLQNAADTDGALLQIESLNPPTGVAEPEHVHPRQESRATLITGTLRFFVNGQPRQLGAGETITIPAGTPHHFVNEGRPGRHLRSGVPSRPSHRRALPGTLRTGRARQARRTRHALSAHPRPAGTSVRRRDPGNQPAVADPARRVHIARAARPPARSQRLAPKGDSVSHVVSSSAGQGRLKKYPWALSQPSSTSISSAASSSTPSATTVRPRLWASSIVERTITASPCHRREVHDEGPVDLDLVDRQLLQVDER